MDARITFENSTQPKYGIVQRWSSQIPPAWAGNLVPKNVRIFDATLTDNTTYKVTVAVKGATYSGNLTVEDGKVSFTGEDFSHVWAVDQKSIVISSTAGM